MSEKLLEFYSPPEPRVGMSLEETSKKALDLISLIPGGVLQSELKKMLQVESSKCSKIVTRLEKDGMIKRQKASLNGARTYLLKPTTKPKSRTSQSNKIQIPIPQKNNDRQHDNRMGDSRQSDARQVDAEQRDARLTEAKHKDFRQRDTDQQAQTIQAKTQRTYAQQSYAIQTNVRQADVQKIYIQEPDVQKLDIQKFQKPNARQASANHIDSYLTEIYLLYLIRGIES